MDVFDRLRRDHAECRILLGQLDQPGGLTVFGREELYRNLKRKLLAHDKAEERVLYDRLGRDPLVDDGRREHDELEDMLDEIGEIPPADPRWMRQMRRLKDRFLHHIGQEEETLFPRAGGLFPQEATRTMAEDVDRQEALLLRNEAGP